MPGSTSRGQRRCQLPVAGEHGLLVVEFLLLVVAEFLLSSREDVTRSWGNFLVYFSHNAMPT